MFIAIKHNDDGRIEYYNVDQIECANYDEEEVYVSGVGRISPLNEHNKRSAELGNGEIVEKPVFRFWMIGEPDAAVYYGKEAEDMHNRFRAACGAFPEAE